MLGPRRGVAIYKMWRCCGVEKSKFARSLFVKFANWNILIRWFESYIQSGSIPLFYEEFPWVLNWQKGSCTGAVAHVYFEHPTLYLIDQTFSLCIWHQKLLQSLSSSLHIWQGLYTFPYHLTAGLAKIMMKYTQITTPLRHLFLVEGLILNGLSATGEILFELLSTVS
jgi:hypothetical protein